MMGLQIWMALKELKLAQYTVSHWAAPVPRAIPLRADSYSARYYEAIDRLPGVLPCSS